VYIFSDGWAGALMDAYIKTLLFPAASTHQILNHPLDHLIYCVFSPKPYEAILKG
jgi:hypothetical protein